MFETVNAWIIHNQKASSHQLGQVIARVARAPFAGDLLEIEEPLWGSFWHGDVIAPGYRLPAIELALLRAIRLDDAWPENTTIATFMTDLRRAILDPRAGVWALQLSGQPCVVFAAGRYQPPRRLKSLVTIVWYCATTEKLHAGYRFTPVRPLFQGAIEQRQPDFTFPHRPALTKKAHWLDAAIERDHSQNLSLAARLDHKILKIRAVQNSRLS